MGNIFHALSQKCLETKGFCVMGYSLSPYKSRKPQSAEQNVHQPTEKTRLALSVCQETMNSMSGLEFYRCPKRLQPATLEAKISCSVFHRPPTLWNPFQIPAIRLGDTQVNSAQKLRNHHTRHHRQLPVKNYFMDTQNTVLVHTNPRSNKKSTDCVLFTLYGDWSTTMLGFDAEWRRSIQ